MSGQQSANHTLFVSEALGAAQMHMPVAQCLYFEYSMHSASYDVVCRGITPCMVGIIPYAGLDIAAFELMRDELHQRYNHNPPPQHLLVAGMLSSTGAQLVAYHLGLQVQQFLDE